MGDTAGPDLGAWGPWRPDELAARLRNLDVPWAVAGGWALDLFAGDESRQHSDIEIVVAWESLAAVRSLLPGLVWFGVGQGQTWPIDAAPPELHQTWGWDLSRECWRVDVMREPWEGKWWVYRRNPAIRRPLAEAIERTGRNLPYLAPEIVLLYKAKGDDCAKDESDFDCMLPLLSQHRRSWLIQALDTAHPGHRWMSLLAG